MWAIIALMHIQQNTLFNNQTGGVCLIHSGHAYALAKVKCIAYEHF